MGQPSQDKKRPVNVSTGHEQRVSCEQIAQLWSHQVPQTVTEIFTPFPSELRARRSDSADLPPLCSQPAGSHSIIASATSIVLPNNISHISSLDKGKNIQKGTAFTKKGVKLRSSEQPRRPRTKIRGLLGQSFIQDTMAVKSREYATGHKMDAGGWFARSSAPSGACKRFREAKTLELAGFIPANSSQIPGVPET